MARSRPLCLEHFSSGAIGGAVWLLLAARVTLSAATPTLDELTSRALVALRSGQPATAELLLEQATLNYPASAGAWVLLGSAYSQLERAGDAIQAYRHALRLDPSSANALFNLGVLYLRRTNYREAAATLQRFCASHPRDAGALIAYAHALFRLGQATLASRIIAQAIRADDAPEFVVRASQVLLEANRPSDASHLLKSALERRPSCKDCRSRLARAEYRLAHHSKVVALLYEGGQPEAADDPLILASSLREIGRDQEVTDVLENAIHRFPGEKLLYLGLVQAYRSAGQYESLVRVLRKANDRWPQDAQFASPRPPPSGDARLIVERWGDVPVKELSPSQRSVLLRARLELNQFLLAEQLARATLALGNSPESTVITLANLLQVQQRDIEALAILEGQRSRFGDSSSYLFTLALTQFNLGRYASSYELVKAALGRRPDLDQAHFLGGHCLASQGLQKEALSHYESALELSPQKPRYQFQVGLLIQQLGRNNEAQPYLKRAVDLDSSFAAARYQLAKAYFDSGRPELALDQLQIAVKLDPADESSHYLLTRVYARLGRSQDVSEALARLRKVQAETREARHSLGSIPDAATSFGP